MPARCLPCSSCRTARSSCRRFLGRPPPTRLSAPFLPRFPGSAHGGTLVVFTSLLHYWSFFLSEIFCDKNKGGFFCFVFLPDKVLLGNISCVVMSDGTANLSWALGLKPAGLSLEPLRPGPLNQGRSCSLSHTSLQVQRAFPTWRYKARVPFNRILLQRRSFPKLGYIFHAPSPRGEKRSSAPWGICVCAGGHVVRGWTSQERPEPHKALLSVGLADGPSVRGFP